jgi:tetratricopeptide (TPR) repeat protein
VRRSLPLESCDHFCCGELHTIKLFVCASVSVCVRVGGEVAIVFSKFSAAYWISLSQMPARASAESKAAEKADAKYNAMDWSGALQLYECALRLAPNHSNAWFWHFRCGYVLAELTRFFEAIEAYTQSIAHNSKYVLSYNNRGHCYYHLKRLDEAMAGFNEAIRLDPAHASSHANRSLLWAQWKEWTPAIIEDLTKALTLTKDVARIQRMARDTDCTAHIRSGRFCRVESGFDWRQTLARLKGWWKQRK